MSRNTGDAYSEEFKKDVIVDVIVTGKSAFSVAKERGIDYKTCKRWIDGYLAEQESKNNTQGDNTSNDANNTDLKKVNPSAIVCANERVEDVLKKMERHQIELEQLAYEELLKKLSTARASEIVNLLNITTNQYKSGNGKPTDVIAVKTWDSFLDDID